MKKPQKVALVCDWLTELGGGERVIRAVHEMYPEAPIYTSQYRPERAPWFDDATVKTGWLNHLPVGLRRFVPFLRQWYFSRLDLTEYDLVISITGAEAKAVKTRDDALHVSYIHAPTQYYWTLYDDYIKNPGFGVLNPLARVGLKLLVKPLRKADLIAAKRPDVIVVPSSYIKDEVKECYERDSRVVYPCVDVDGVSTLASRANKSKREGYIVYGRQVSWKRFDLAIEAVKQTGDKLLVIGDGPERGSLEALADGADNITFLPRYNGIGEIVERICSSKAFLFTSLEPFGIAPVEALACGTPVIGLHHAGALDIVQDGKNGLFFDEQSVESLVGAMKRFDKTKFDEARVMRSAQRFSEDKFKDSMRAVIEQELGG